MRSPLAFASLAAMLALAACTTDDDPAANPPSTPGRAATAAASTAPAAPPPAAAPIATADASADGADAPSAVSVFRRMVESIAALAKQPADDTTAETPQPPAQGTSASASPPASASAPAAAAAPALAALPPPAAAPPVVAPPVVSPRASAKPSAAACADVTADGPAKEVDLQAVRRLLEGTDFQRGSFETNASYRARVIVKLEAVQALAIEQTGRAELVFSVPIPQYRLRYDTAAHALLIGSDLGLLPVGSAIGMNDFVVVSTSEREIGHHRDTISYGVRQMPGVEREVTRVAGDELGVQVAGGSATGWPAKFERLSVPMTPAEAADRSGLAVLFVAHLQEPIFVTGEYVQEPKLDDPVEKHLTVQAIRIAVDCAAIYDRKTGRLIHPLIPAGG
ncbi:MAG TPA: hypothetical protein VMB81_27150 [Candidatus Sulfotelmatobacter sp.]|nr:hypothetical protein [Candidatus Sulfotelmatobacter sp.]